MVNVVDQPALCDMTTPSLLDREPVVVAIGTEGTAPVLARRIKTQIKTQIEQMLDPHLGSFAALAGRLRSAGASGIASRDRRAFWRRAVQLCRCLPGQTSFPRKLASIATRNG